MRSMSFFATQDQIRNKTKTVTRRLGWGFLRPGDLIWPVVKSQGLKKGERQERIGDPIRIVSIRKEPLSAITIEDVDREGFPGKSVEWFVKMFCELNKCKADLMINRIEFEYAEVKRAVLTLSIQCQRKDYRLSVGEPDSYGRQVVTAQLINTYHSYSTWFWFFVTSTDFDGITCPRPILRDGLTAELHRQSTRKFIKDDYGHIHTCKFTAFDGMEWEVYQSADLNWVATCHDAEIDFPLDRFAPEMPLNRPNNFSTLEALVQKKMEEVQG